jgi:hypothetical protein
VSSASHRICQNKKAKLWGPFVLAEEVRFELTEGLPPRQFSRLVP